MKFLACRMEVYYQMVTFIAFVKLERILVEGRTQ